MINPNLGGNGKGLHYGKSNQKGRKNCVTFFLIFNNKTHVILFLTRKLLFSLMCFHLQFYFWFFWTAFVISIFFHWSISFIVTWIMNSNYNFISNNVKGIKASERRLKLFEYLRSNINNDGFVFLQETHSLLKDKQKWKDNVKGPLFFFTWKK